MATGLPVIVTDVGGNKEAVVNFQNGFVIAPGERAELERHLLTLHRDPALRTRLAAGSRARVESLFSLQQMIDRHESLYSALAENGSGVAA
jgi:glycosyltransferase involved in cell wall biosynthesis